MSETTPATAIEIAPELQGALAQLQAFALPLTVGEPANFAQALLLARVAERNLFVDLKHTQGSKVLGRKVRSPIDGAELRIVDTDINTSKFTNAFVDAYKLMDGHIVVLHQGKASMSEKILDLCGLSVQVDLTRPLFFTRVGAMKPSILSADLDKIQEIIGQVYKASIESMAPRLVALRRATDPKTGEFAFIHGEHAKDSAAAIAVGLSQRIAFDLMLLATTVAVINGRTEITNDDLARVFVAGTLHRVTLTKEGAAKDFDTKSFLKRTVEGVMAASTEKLSALSNEPKQQAHLHTHGDNCGCSHDHHH